ncbi:MULTISPECIES: lipoyl synthase [unclassified Nitrospina]|uniref:lipoyl synthase n=1 Tax=unclassified Nitrospina TaxID=2638683 RepID=UPI003F9A7BD0
MRLPDWLKTPLPKNPKFFHLKSLVRQHGLHTVCESASCPNIGKCWDRGTLTIMILGNTCTRACRFCDVDTGHLQPPRMEEPEEVALMLSKLNLRYVVITSVDRDDLKDGGSALWAETIRQVRKHCPELKIEALIPDFQGDKSAIQTVCDATPDVLAHNLETVASLQKMVRPQCRYEWSLDTLSVARRSGLIAKSSLMLGMGETHDEIVQTMKDLLHAGCQILTLGQYLRPTRDHLEVKEFIHPDRFAEYKRIGEDMGFDHVESGPLVRSSYEADRQAGVLGLV